MNTLKTTLRNTLTSILVMLSVSTYAQQEPLKNIAVLNIDCHIKSIGDAQSMGNMVRLELEKTKKYVVLDKYEVNETLAKDNVDIATCLSKSCLVRVGKLLNVNKMLSGSADQLGEKIVITLRLIDVETGTIEKSDATEFQNLPEIQKMVQIAVQKIVGIQPDKVLMNQLVDYDVPVQSPKNTLHLNGPRMGCSALLGNAGKIMTAPVSVGGFNMSPVTFDFGWQQEIQYISAGNFQALVENIFLISGLESGRFIPNYAPLLGFRFGKQAWEFAFGPTFRFIKVADGFYDSYNDWHLQGDGTPQNGSPIISRLDSRGDVKLSTGLVVAFGRTFRSGYLNIPVNVYVAPRKDATTVGATFGFNIQKKEKKKDNRQEQTDYMNR